MHVNYDHNARYIYVNYSSHASYIYVSYGIHATCTFTWTKTVTLRTLTQTITATSHIFTWTHYVTFIAPLTAKLFNWNFHPLKVVYRWRDPQLQMSKNSSDLTKWRSTIPNFLLIDVTFYLHYVKANMQYSNKNVKNEYNRYRLSQNMTFTLFTCTGTIMTARIIQNYSHLSGRIVADFKGYMKINYFPQKLYHPSDKQ